MSLSLNSSRFSSLRPQPNAVMDICLSSAGFGVGLAESADGSGVGMDSSSFFFVSFSEAFSVASISLNAAIALLRALTATGTEDSSQA